VLDKSISRCSVCNHKEKEAIERDILDKRLVTEIQAEYNVSRSSIYRHISKHLPSSVAEHIKNSNLDSLSSIRSTDSKDAAISVAEQLQYLYGRALATMDNCEKSKDYQTSIRAQRQALSCLEIFFKASESIYKLKNDSKTVGEAEVMRKIILEALKDHPEARLAVAKAIGEEKININ